MELLKSRIINDGVLLGTDLVKVDSFLNHQLDIGLLKALGKEIYCRFGHLGINKILTMEASGIAIASVTSMYFDLAPVVYAKKTLCSTTGDAYYQTKVKSFIDGTCSTAVISKCCLSARDRVLIIGDFLAHGEAAKGLADLVAQAGGTVCAITAVIEKEFQGGGEMLRDMGYFVDSLVIIEKIENGVISFKDTDECVCHEKQQYYNTPL
ncbi:xanthine phosphoribosyltransferase [Chakrabartyella piscis]|uniref:xanthine phosphoribosyltransferase n=1 Tax=Chakrabartyella piscis TaxID=2918914 RepID=UPI002958A574|nr:xanthine phosphoribosyltransferase [Chakrabartyella piscis]